jgi:hypothetical protein
VLVIDKEVVVRDGEGRITKIREIHARRNAVAALGDGQRGRLSLLAGRTVLEDAVRRLLRRESDRARRASSSLQRLEGWANGFYIPSEVDRLAADLEPALAALAGLPDPAALARSLATEMHAASLHALRQLARSGPADVKTAVFNLTTSWLEHRPSAIADSVLARCAS